MQGRGDLGQGLKQMVTRDAKCQHTVWPQPGTYPPPGKLQSWGSGHPRRLSTDPQYLERARSGSGLIAAPQGGVAVTLPAQGSPEASSPQPRVGAGLVRRCFHSRGGWIVSTWSQRWRFYLPQTSSFTCSKPSVRCVSASPRFLVRSFFPSWHFSPPSSTGLAFSWGLRSSGLGLGGCLLCSCSHQP